MTNHPIVDFDIYNAQMGKGLLDKLFFVDKINPDCIIDFGCADGFLLKNLKTYLPETHMVGYDCDPQMVKLAEEGSDIEFFSDWQVIKGVIEQHRIQNHKIAIILSSVVHEVYHYQGLEIDDFWKMIFSGDFHFIVLRDMIPNRSIDRLTDISDVSRVYREFLGSQELKDFENIWGSIESNKNLTHFLLKYRYKTPNWNREVRENYLPLYREDLLSMIPKEYNVMYHEHFVLPFIKRTVKDEVGIDMKDPTHLKLILEKT